MLGRSDEQTFILIVEGQTISYAQDRASRRGRASAGRPGEALPVAGPRREGPGF